MSFILACAGIGKRMKLGYPKQFLEYDGKPLFLKPLLCAEQSEYVDEIIIVSQEEYLEDIKTLCQKEGIHKLKAVVTGGRERQDSIFAALKKVSIDMDYVRTHAEAIQTAGRYNVVSCSGKAVENGLVRLTDYDAVDIDLGLEKDDGHSLYYYKAFRPAMQQQISNYLQHHGNLFVNGAYLASDMKLEAEKQWLANNLKITYAGSNLNNYSAMIKGLGTSFDIYRTINADHYGAYTPDNILPANNTAIAVMAYADGNNAAVAYKGVDYRTFSMAFPLECIKDANTRNKIMRGILAYLLQ